MFAGQQSSQIHVFLLHSSHASSPLLKVIYEVIREIERRRRDDDTPTGAGYAATTLPLDTVSEKPEKGGLQFLRQAILQLSMVGSYFTVAIVCIYIYVCISVH